MQPGLELAALSSIVQILLSAPCTKGGVSNLKHKELISQILENRKENAWRIGDAHLNFSESKILIIYD